MLEVGSQSPLPHSFQSWENAHLTRIVKFPCLLFFFPTSDQLQWVEWEKLAALAL